MDTTRSAVAKHLARFIDANSVVDGASEARLATYGMHVWAIIGYLRAADGDAHEVARAYDVPIEHVNAAMAYFALHTDAINARLVLNSE
ncbi:MAG: hypothetical protein ACYDCQ_14925 [Dehalococcoidia bacterium]